MSQAETIDDQVSNLIDFVTSRSKHTRVGFIDEADGDTYSMYKDLDDHDPIEGYAVGEAVIGPDQLVFDNPDLLRYAFTSFNRQIGSSATSALIEDQIEHEEQHDAAAQKLGTLSSRIGMSIPNITYVSSFGIRRTISYDWQLFLAHEHATAPVTKLAAASVIAATVRPSKGDRRRLADLDYLGEWDVAQRIIRNNEESDVTGRPQLAVPPRYSSALFVR